MENAPVFLQSKTYKLGFAAGFYDAFSDDGVKYLDEIRRFGLGDDQGAQFWAGYGRGRAMRLGDIDAPPPLATLAA